MTRFAPVGEELGKFHACDGFCDFKCMARLEGIGVGNAVRRDFLFYEPKHVFGS